MNKRLENLTLEIGQESEFSINLQKAREAMQRFSETIVNMNIQPIAGLASPFYAQRIGLLMPSQEAESDLALQYCQPLHELLDWDSLEIKWTLDSPERWAYESLVDWGKRLERAGLFDQYEYRWMYQKECVRAMLHSPIWYSRELWWWLRYEAWEVLNK